MSKAIGLTDGGGLSATDTIGSAGAGVGGTVSLQTVLIRPIGISPSIGMAPGEDWFRGNQWPPENTEPPNGAPAHWQQNLSRHFTPVTFPNGPGNPFEVTFPPRAWDPAFYQIVLLGEFARVWSPTAVMDAALGGILANAMVPANQHNERRNLIAMIEFRAGLLNEVVSQMTTFDAYFQGTLGFIPATHPCTNLLVQGCMRAAEFAAMHYKNHFQRPRPSQLWPQLMPPVQVPGHASFPSAHSTQAHTIATVLQKVAAGVVLSVDDVTTRLAQRIARGREVLGLHYPSDTVAGQHLAQDVATAFMAAPEIARLITAAQKEWEAFAV
jgi:membrane-associated phospholipid phosphatase